MSEREIIARRASRSQKRELKPVSSSIAPSLAPIRATIARIFSSITRFRRANLARGISATLRFLGARPAFLSHHRIYASKGRFCKTESARRRAHSVCNAGTSPVLLYNPFAPARTRAFRASRARRDGVRARAGGRGEGAVARGKSMQSRL